MASDGSWGRSSEPESLESPARATSVDFPIWERFPFQRLTTSKASINLLPCEIVLATRG